MKHHVLVKFLALLLCAVSLFGCLSSAAGMFVLSYANLYDRTVDQLKEERIQQNAEEFSQQAALRYASETLGGCPTALLDSRYLTQDVYLNLFQSGKYHFRLEDAEGNVLSSQGDAIPDGTEYVFPVTGQYLHLVSKETEQERRAKEAKERADFYGADVVTAEGVTIPAEGASVTYASFLGTSGELLLEIYYDGDGTTYLFHSPSSFTFEDFALNSAADLMVNHEGKLVFRSPANHSELTHLNQILSGSPVTQATFFCPGELSLTLDNNGADVGYLSIDENNVISFISWDSVATAPAPTPLTAPEQVVIPDAPEVVNTALPQEGASVGLAAFYDPDGALLLSTIVGGYLYPNQEGGLSYIADNQNFSDNFVTSITDKTVAYVFFLDAQGTELFHAAGSDGVGTLECTSSRLIFKTNPGLSSLPEATAETQPQETTPQETEAEASGVLTVILPDGSRVPLPEEENTGHVEEYARYIAEELAKLRENAKKEKSKDTNTSAPSGVSVVFPDGTIVPLPAGDGTDLVKQYALEVAARTTETTKPAEETEAAEETKAAEETTKPEETEVTVPPTEETIAETAETTEAATETTVPATEPVTVPEETIVPTEPVIINGKDLSEYQLETDKYYDPARQQTVYVSYVRVPLPQYTFVLELAPDALRDDALYALLGVLRDHRGSIWAVLGVCLLVFSLTVLYLCIAAGRKPKSDEVCAGGLNRMPLDLYFSLAFGGIVLAIAFGIEGLRHLSSNLASYGMFFIGMIFTACLVFVAFCFAFVAQIKTPGGFWWRNSLCGYCVRLWFRLVRWLEKAMKESGFPLLRQVLKNTWKFCKAAAVESWHLYKMLADFCVKFCKRFFQKINRTLQRFFSLLPLTWQWLLTGCVIIFIAALTLNSYNGFAVIIGLMLILGIVLYGSHCFGVLSESTRNMSKGDLNTKVDDKLLLGCFKDFAVDLNDLADVAVVAAQKQLRSERMKTELITNVSHDIKTPLTSIINYVDLLQKPHTPEEQVQYLEVLDRQSQRLKKLIDDLMEMSKANTGNMAVDITTLDAAESVNQALGEFADKLTAARLTPVFRHPEQQVSMLADGKLVWRVLSNLLSNAVKYAMPGTRIYIDLMEMEGKVILSLKNISREELNVDADELMERFVRGDDSRNTEGSGLGLNIARSLMELQKGQLQLLVDGDLFKVTLIFPGA